MNASKTNILIVSADLIHTAQLQILLSSLSKNIASLSSYEQGLSFFQPAQHNAANFNLIIMELPKAENLIGKNLCNELLAIIHANNRAAKLVLMTAENISPSCIDEFPMKACFLKKPAQFHQLKDALCQLGIVLKKINCWDYKQCGREPGGCQTASLGECPAAKDPKNEGVHEGKKAGRACWVVSGTLCEGTVQGSFAAKLNSCLDCDFYKLVKTEEGGNFESIDKILLERQGELTRSSVSEGIFGVDVHGAITSFNAAAEKMTGYGSQMVLGKPHHLFFSKPQAGEAPGVSANCSIFASMDSGEVHRSQDEFFWRQDGSRFPVQIVSAPIIEDGTVVGAVILFKDITDELRIQQDKEKAEQELRELAETLEERVQHRTAELHTANLDLMDTLNKLQQAQSQLVQAEKMAALGGLVAGVAHEINTPVGIAYTASTHLEKETLKVLASYHDGGMKRRDLEEYLSTCQESTKLLQSNLNRAGELIRSFKQVASDQSGEVKRKFHLREYLGEVVLSLGPILKKTKHTIAIECDKAIELDSYPGAFSQILTNLITNSVNHAFNDEDSGNISIVISLEGNTLLFHYIDDGNGITAEDIKHIFDPFFTTNREKGGSGLGLHIIFNVITQKLNGTIACHSEPGQGTTFTIKIPQ